MKDKRGKFILLGNTRIKIGNIKDYGISSEWVKYEKIYKPIMRNGNGLVGVIIDITAVYKFLRIVPRRHKRLKGLS